VRSRWWLLPSLAFVATRIWLILIPFGLIPYLGGTIVINDVTLYAQWAELLRGGQFPIDDPMWQYPPLIGPVLALGSLIPPSPTVGLVMLLLAADTATFIVLMRSVSRGGDVEGAWAWIAAGMLIGPVWLTRFDVVPALFAVLGLLAMARPVRAGAWLAVGALFKVWPLLLMVAVPRRSWPKAILGFVVTAASMLIAVLITMDDAGSFASQQAARGLQIESVPALVFLVGWHLGWPRTFEYRYGAMEVMAQATQTVALIATAVGFASLAALAIWRLLGRLDARLPADIALVVVLLSMATSRVLSPQYLVWVAAIAAVCMLSRDTVMRPVIVLLMPVAALGQLLYPMHYNWLMSDDAGELLVQVARIVLLLTATGVAVWRLLRTGDRMPQVGVQSVEKIGQAA
jgi:hypothetical protein